LRWFIVTDNALKTVPNALGECRKLQKLMLAGNQLTVLPESMANCHALELLRISANKFESLPNWLFSLPKLSWLAYAGNPFCDKIENALLAQHHIPQIDWGALKLQQQLGEGASGNIYQAIWQTVAGNKTIAVKMFKANLTSDGLPRCEVHATTLADQHPNLLGLEGIIYNHPAEAAGLVMPLMDADLTVLADPPSFESCTRDVYAPNTQFSLQALLHIAGSVASAVSHLHAQGITHGDLYAHNILTNHKNTTAKKCTLTDLGGASFLPQDNLAQSLQLQRIESRAFACLLEELLTHCNVNNQTTSLLWQLQAECGQEDVALRPLFNEIIQKLNLMQPL
jgi:serine/threonine protein kinase